VRIAVTSTAARAGSLSSALAALGFEAISLPCLRAEVSGAGELARARAACEDADLVVLSSPRPIGLLWEEGFPHVPAAVCGANTADEVEKRGGEVWASTSGNVVQLSRMIAPHLPGRRVAYPHARGADPRAITALGDAASGLTAVAVYELLPEPPPREPVDGVVFSHPRAVDGWLLSRGLANLFVVTVGRATMGALGRHGRRPDLALRPADEQSLASAMFHASRAAAVS